MLTDITFDICIRDYCGGDETKLGDWIEHLQTGVYSTGFGGTLDEWSSDLDREYSWVRRNMRLQDAWEPDTCYDFPEYGVCDNVEQILTRCPELRRDPYRKFVLNVCQVLKEDEDCQNWRWHKHGEYIGTQKPQAEYLFDEPVIERVVCYELYEVCDTKRKQTHEKRTQ